MTDACPNCMQRLEAATHVAGDETPRAGDFTLCLYCGSLLIFESVMPLRHRLPTVAEAQEFAAYQDHTMAEQIVRQFPGGER